MLANRWDWWLTFQVKVVIFSTTGERAAPFFRKAANDFRDFAAFGLVLWREENATLWENMYDLLTSSVYHVIDINVACVSVISLITV